MSDEMIVTTAEPSPADAALRSMTPEQRNDWRTTGELPKKQAQEETTVQADGETAADSPSDKPQEHKPKGLSPEAQKRIDKLTAQKYELRDQNKLLLERLTAIEAKVNGKPEEPKAKIDPNAKPDAANYDDGDKFNEDFARWAARQERKEHEEKQAKSAEELSAKEIFDAYQERARAAAAKYDDWDEVVSNQKIPLGGNEHTSNAVYNTILELPNGEEVGYYLGKNPDVAAELAEIKSPFKAIAFVTRLSDSLMPEPEEKDEPAPVKKETAAPAPVREIAARSVSSGDPVMNAVAKKNYAEYKRLANQQGR